MARTYSIPGAVLAKPDNVVPSSSKLVFMALLEKKTRGGKVKVDVDEIVTVIGLSRRTIFRGIENLLYAKLLKREGEGEYAFMA